jgi:hypothetical protein
LGGLGWLAAWSLALRWLALDYLTNWNFPDLVFKNL